MRVQLPPAAPAVTSPLDARGDRGKFKVVYDSIYNDLQNKDLRRKLRGSQTDAERKIWSVIRGKKLGFKFFRQYGVGKYVLDFYCPGKRLAIELDGGQHNEDKARIYDGARTEFLNKQNIKVLRFWDNEVFSNIDGIIETIIRELNSP